jgi:hypothetical protein
MKALNGIGVVQLSGIGVVQRILRMLTIMFTMLALSSLCFAQSAPSEQPRTDAGIEVAKVEMRAKRDATLRVLIGTFAAVR